MQKTNDNSLAARFQAEHDELMQVQAEVGRAYRQFRDAPSPETQTHLEVVLSEFGSHLTEHFTAEEEEGMLQLDGGLQPADAREVVRLRSEHGEMRTEMAHLSTDLGRRLGDPGEAAVIGETIHHLFHRLHDHEAAENRLMMETYWDDSGPAD